MRNTWCQHLSKAKEDGVEYIPGPVPGNSSAQKEEFACDAHSGFFIHTSTSSEDVSNSTLMGMISPSSSASVRSSE